MRVRKESESESEESEETEEESEESESDGLIGWWSLPSVFLCFRCCKLLNL